MSTMCGVLLLMMPLLTTVVSGQFVVDGSWSPWQIDPDIDCCAFGGYERVRRYCNNPTPDNGGANCDNQQSVASTTEEVWRSCTCACYPLCDDVTSFCANDTGGPARCFCKYGMERAVNYDPNAVVVCIDAVVVVEVTTSVETCSVMEDTTSADAAKIIRYVGAAWIIFWIVLIIVVMLAFRATYGARFLHLVEELTLAITLVLMVAPFEESIADDEMPCKIVSFLAQYLFQVCMMFFFLEALHAYSLVSFITAENGILKMIFNFLIGFGVPLVTCGASLAFAYDKYGTSTCHCLCDFGSSQSWGYLLPVGVFAFCVAIVGEAAASERYKQLIDTAPDQYIHATVCRKGVLFVTPLAVLVYMFGLIAVDTQSLVLFILYAVFAFLLGPIIFIYHTAPDKNVSTAFNNKAQWLPWYKAYLFKPSAPDEPESGVQMTSRGDGGGAFKDFYKWVTDGRQVGDVAKESEDVLFKTM